MQKAASKKWSVRAEAYEEAKALLQSKPNLLSQETVIAILSDPNPSRGSGE